MSCGGLRSNHAAPSPAGTCSFPVSLSPGCTWACPSRSYCCQPYLPQKQYVPCLVLMCRICHIPLPAAQPHQLCPGTAATLGTPACATPWHSAITPSGSCPLPLSHLGFVIEHSFLCQNMSAEQHSREPLSNSTQALLQG